MSVKVEQEKRNYVFDYSFYANRISAIIIFSEINMEQRRLNTKRILYLLFGDQNPLSPRLQLLSQIIQSLAYLTIISGTHFSDVLKSFSQSYVIFTALLIVCLLKITVKVILRFGITLIALQIIITKCDLWLIPNCFLLIIISIFQIQSSIFFDFSSSFVDVESRIQNKVIHHLLIMGNIIILNVVQTPTYVHLISAVLFLGLFWRKECSLMKNEGYRTIVLLFYLYAACEHIRLFLAQFLPFSSTLLASLASFFLSQFLYVLLVQYRSTPTCHQLLAKEEHLRLAFFILRNINSTFYDENIEQFIQNIAQNSVQVQKRLLKDSDQKQHSTQQSNRAIYPFVLLLLSRSNGFLQDLLRAEIYLKTGQVLLAIETLKKTKAHLNWYNLLQKMMLLHAQQRIANMFADSSSKVTYLYEQALRSFYNFQEMIYKAALQHLKFNLYLKRTQIELIKIKKICQKIITQDKQIVEEFQRVRMGFSASTQLFVGFLAFVVEDYKNAQKVISQQQLREIHSLNGHLQEKIFIHLLLTSDGLIINRVGLNALRLLGYNRSELEGQAVQCLVPPFFRSDHKKISTAFVHGSSQRLLLFQKQTIVLNGRVGYNLCEIVLKMRMDEDQICYDGYLRVVESKQHDLTSFFSVNAEGVLLQFSKGLFEEESAVRQIINVKNLFSDQVGRPLERMGCNQAKQIYEPILKFCGQSQYYFYSKRINNNQKIICENIKKNIIQNTQTASIQVKQHKNMQISEQMTQVNNINMNKEIHILLILVGIFLLGLFGSEYLMIISANVKYNNQNFAIYNFINLIQFYDNAIRMQIGFQYLDFREYYNYSNTFSSTDIDKLALNLHSVNEKLKVFNLGKRSVPTYNPAINYQESNYEIILMLAADAYLYKKFSNDSFMKLAAANQARRVTPVSYLQSSIDYRTSIFNLMTNFVQDDNYYENLSFIVSMANILIFVFLGARIYWKLKSIEQQVLKQRCLTSSKSSKIKDILDFLKEITYEQVSIDLMRTEMGKYQAPVETANNTKKIFNVDPLISEASLIKESSRDMFSGEKVAQVADIPSPTPNKTSFIEQMDKNKKKDGNKNSNHILIQTNSYRYVLLAFGLFVGILTILDSINQISNNQNKSLDEVASLNSVLNLYRSTTYYSVRGVIITFNAMLQKNMNGVDISATYLPAIAFLQNFILTFAPPVFPEAKFSEFNNFSSYLIKLYQDPICNYITCDPQYYDQVNLNFISVTKKYSLNLSSMFQSTINYTQQEMTKYLIDNKRYIDLIFYTQMILKGCITDLVMNYLDSYNIFFNNLYRSKFSFINTMITINVIGAVLFLLFVCEVKRQKQLMVNINNIYDQPKEA